MTTNIFSVLNTAKLGLLSQQLSIEVTGHNIANVQTEGFSRQQVVFEANSPRTTGLGQIGTGVRVAGIERFHDQFLLRQFLTENDPLGKFTVQSDLYERVEILFNDNQGRSLNQELSDFFGSLQDLATHPAGLAERADLVARGQSLADVFNHLGEQLFQIQRDIDDTLETDVVEINDMLREIAKLNTQIHENEPAEIQANDLRDKRDKLITDLSKKIDVQLINESDGQLSLTLDDGTALVLRDTAFELSTQLNGNNQSFRDILISTGGSGTKNITSAIQGGEMRGNLDMRDQEVDSILDKLDRLAAAFVTEFNRVHQEGFGLDGSTGVNFFTPLSPTVFTDTGNTGSAVVTAQNADPANAKIDEYELAFTGSNAFTLNNLTTGFASGTFTFTPGSTFNLAGGLAVTITGTAAAGDRFRVSLSEGAAQGISVSDTVVGDSRKIAAGKTQNVDGDNALALADLQDRLVFDSVTLKSGSGAFTFDEFYNAIVSTIGIQSASARSSLDQQEGVTLLLKNRRESVAGVSIDEEMVNMIKFQQAFNASARVIATVEELFDTLINRI